MVVKKHITQLLQGFVSDIYITESLCYIVLKKKNRLPPRKIRDFFSPRRRRISRTDKNTQI